MFIVKTFHNKTGKKNCTGKIIMRISMPLHNAPHHLFFSEISKSCFAVLLNLLCKYLGGVENFIQHPHGTQFKNEKWKKNISKNHNFSVYMPKVYYIAKYSSVCEWPNSEYTSVDYMPYRIVYTHIIIPVNNGENNFHK